MITKFKELIDALAAAAKSHIGIESFDAGDAEYFLSPNRTPVFPHAYFQYQSFERAGTTLSLNGQLIVLHKLPTEEAYDKDTDPYNWNQNGITQIDAAKETAEQLITLLDSVNYNGNLSVSRSYTATYSGKATTSSVGWQIPLQISVELAIDPNDIPTT